MLKTYIRDELATLGRLGILSIEDQVRAAETSLAASFVPNVSDVPGPVHQPAFTGRRRARRGSTSALSSDGRVRPSLTRRRRSVSARSSEQRHLPSVRVSSTNQGMSAVMSRVGTPDSHQGDQEGRSNELARVAQPGCCAWRPGLPTTRRPQRPRLGVSSRP